MKCQSVHLPLHTRATGRIINRSGGLRVHTTAFDLAVSKDLQKCSQNPSTSCLTPNRHPSSCLNRYHYALFVIAAIRPLPAMICRNVLNPLTSCSTPDRRPSFATAVLNNRYRYASFVIAATRPSSTPTLDRPITHACHPHLSLSPSERLRKLLSRRVLRRHLQVHRDLGMPIRTM
ncbi:hypothetical protein EJ03DRAFT_206642 [Teratosphaeria nubilosa]|uniref:Uncharacterized protein n=1 Tax=Teratosphaeria nubilosa TaxID=161662 RepID=A0A6G1KXT5_9PEZI|nr:hypothetical protein EJ03DRAFT_206642 [Teratosphaeria nubilosa]